MEVEAAPATPQPRAPAWARKAKATGAFVLRVTQLASAFATLATTTSTVGASAHPALCFLAATSALQCVCTIPPALVDLFAMVSGQWPLESHHWAAVGSATVAGDSVAAALSFCAASAASGVATMVDGNLKLCGMLPCSRFRAASWMGFACCIVLLPTLLFNWLSNDAAN